MLLDLQQHLELPAVKYNTAFFGTVRTGLGLHGSLVWSQLGNQCVLVTHPQTPSALVLPSCILPFFKVMSPRSTWSQVRCHPFQFGKLLPHSDLALLETLSGSFDLNSKTSKSSCFAKLSCWALQFYLLKALDTYTPTNQGLAVQLLREENKTSNSQQQEWKQLLAQLYGFLYFKSCWKAQLKKQRSGIQLLQC